MIDGVPKARRNLRGARRLWSAGHHAPARTRAAAAVTTFETVYRRRGTNLGELVSALNLLAGFTAALAQHAQAEELHERVVALLTAAPAESGRVPLLTDALVQLGDGQRAQGKYPAAARSLAAARALSETEDLEPTQRAGVSNALGILAKDTGRYEEAARHYAATLALLEPALGSNSPLLAPAYHNIAGLAHVQGHFAAAEEPARRALTLREEGKADPTEVAADAAVLGAVLSGLGRYDEAEGLFRRALSTWEHQYGPDHYEVAVNLHNLAAVAQGRGDLAASERLFTTALQIKTRALGDRHPEVAVVLNNLAVLYTKQGRTEEALRHYEAALDILEQTLGSVHPTTVTCRGNRVRLVG